MSTACVARVRPTTNLLLSFCSEKCVTRCIGAVALVWCMIMTLGCDGAQQEQNRQEQSQQEQSRQEQGFGDAQVSASASTSAEAPSAMQQAASERAPSAPAAPAATPQEVPTNSDAIRPPSDPSAAKAPKLGPVHKLTVQDLDGNNVSLAQFAGRPMIIEIWATWCGPCKVNRRNVHSLKGLLPERLVVIGMSMDTGPQLVKSFLRSNEANAHEFMASEEFNSFIRDINPSGLIPKTLYVDSKGRVADLAEGVQSVDWLKAMAKNLK
ncbi:MAG: TlpA disulfide reductase family protein [Limnohabitans sp.]|nr:TlpA disulfide reductase family protein [Limnohabitans sp.]